MRRTALLVVSASVLASAAGAVTVAVVPAGAATTAAPGSYVALSTQSRVVDTRTGAGGNHKGAVKAGRTIAVKVAGVGRVPATGVGSVAVTVTAMAPTGTGGLVVYGGTRPATTNLRFSAGGAPVTNTAVVPLSSGRMHIANTASRGSAQVAVDVSGYYRSGAPSSSNPGIWHVLATARRVATVDLRGGASQRVAIGGHAGVPSGAGAAGVTLTVTAATRSGTILGHRPDEPKQNLPLVRFAAGEPVSSFAAVRLSGGKTTLVNTSSRSVHIAIDVAGWYTIGFAQSAHAFQTLVQTRVANTHIGGGASLTVKVAGRGGMPLRDVSAVLVTLHALSPTRTGGLQAWRAGATRPRSTTVLQFRDGRSASNVALVPVSSDGRIALHNTAKGRTGLAVDIDGYVPATTLNPPPGSGSVARYIRTVDGTAIADAGTVDASASFVVLDIGAQLNNQSGVQLTGTSTNLTYDDLVDQLNLYVEAYAAAGGTGGTVAIGTNNDADDWTQYTATHRGHDWANKVIDRVAAANPTVTIAGANDIEPGFFSTERQAEAWETAFLEATPSDLVFNGSADGCPKTWTPGAACAFGWTAKQLYRLATGVGHPGRTSALPQIFVGYMATQWAEIDKTGGGGITFVGSLTEHAIKSGTLTREQGWTALRRAVSSVTTTSIGSAAADIHT